MPKQINMSKMQKHLGSKQAIRQQGLKDFYLAYQEARLDILNAYDDCLLDKDLRNKIVRNLNSINSILDNTFQSR